MQIKLITAAIATLAVSAVCAAPALNDDIIARDVNQANEEVNQLTNLGKQDAESTKQVYEKLGKVFEELAKDFTGDVPTDEDLLELKKQMQEHTQKVKRDADADPQWWNNRVVLNNNFVCTTCNWRFRPGWQFQTSFFRNPAIFDYSYLNFITSFGYDNARFGLPVRYWNGFW